MIAFVEHPEALASFSGNAFACRIRATAAAYGFAHPFARFWVQGRGAALCLLDDVMILDARAGADFDELAAFLPAAGARTVLCSAEAAQALPFPRRATGEIMALRSGLPLWRKRKSSGTPAPGCYIPFYVQAKRPAFSRRRLSRFISTSPTGRATGPPAPPPFARGIPWPPVPSVLQKRRNRRYCPRWLCGRMSGAAGSGRGLSSLWRQACRWIPSIFSALRGKTKPFIELLDLLDTAILQSWTSKKGTTYERKTF